MTIPYRNASIASPPATQELDLSKLREALDNIPIRRSSYLADRLKDVRWQHGEAMKALWPHVLKEATFRSPPAEYWTDSAT